MAQHRRFLDRPNADVRKRIRALSGDPDFVEFILGWYGLLPMDPLVTERASLSTRTWPYWSTSQQRKVKRDLQRRHGSNWREKWKEAQTRARTYEPPRLKAGLFSIDVQGRNPAHGPFRWKFWLAVCDVKNYFTRIAKRPHWDVLAEVFFPGHTFVNAQAEWAKRKGRLSKIDHERNLRRVLCFYETYKPVILEVLKSGVPIWASPHREQFEKLLAEAGIDSILQTITRNEHMVLQQPVASEGKDNSQS